MAANGAVMRTPVLGALLFKEPEQLYTSSINIAATTHADPRCLVSCTIASALVAAVRDPSEFYLNELTGAVAHER